MYLSTIGLIFGVPMVIVLAVWFYEPSTCFDGLQNQGETAVDRGGPCQLLDERRLIPHALLWTRSLPSRPGFYNAVAYIENPNPRAAVRSVPYRFRLYDTDNVLVAEREGESGILPGAITPIFEGSIETRNRTVARTFFEFTGPLVWERSRSEAAFITVSNTQLSPQEARVTAEARNRSVSDMFDVAFVAVLFDTRGNAIATSRTIVPVLPAGETEQLTFTWTEPFGIAQVARIDVLPVLEPRIE